MNYRSRYTLTEAKQQRRTKEGRCAGLLASYIPWILVHEFSSHGWSTRAWSYKMQRIVHLFSRAEYMFFLRLELSAWAAEFYEQFALLPREATDALAEAHNFKLAEAAGVRVVMTSDFKIVTTDGKIAIRALKPADDVEDKERVRQKLQIEKLYWKEFQKVEDWALVTEEESTPGLEWNISWISGERSLEKKPHLKPLVAEATDLSRAWMLGDALTIEETAARLGEKFGSRGRGTTLLRHLLAVGAFPEADMSIQFHLDRQLPLLARRAN